MLRMPGGRRKESVITDLTRTGDELPTIITKLSNGSSFWTTKNAVYPFSRVLRLRVMQIVCGILILVMGAVACIEERGRLTNLALGVPAGLFTVLAAGASIHTSRGFGGYRASSWSEGSILRALGPTPQTAAPLVVLWAVACVLHAALLVQSALVLKSTKLNSEKSTRFQLAIVELILSILTLVAVLEVLRIDLTHDPDLPQTNNAGQRAASSSSDRTHQQQVSSSAEGLLDE
ncbi:uncharacterized protein [Rhodnius prolixus]|uniref:uncharacterized protein n=1 Tax=Rhodnius prolixus TaxID=13249 RepID=UPI003D18B016